MDNTEKKSTPETSVAGPARWLRLGLRLSSTTREHVRKLLRLTHALDYISFAIETASDLVETMQEMFPSLKIFSGRASAFLGFLEELSRDIVIYLDEFTDWIMDILDRIEFPTS